MILFINGPFGIGKTTTARLLVERIPHTILYDPELVGAFLRALLEPVKQVSDFQEYALWPRLTVIVARLLHETCGRSLVIPMTVSHRGRFDLITNGLRHIDPDLLCVRLTASRAGLTQRILARPEAEGPHRWCWDHLDEGLAMSANPAFGLEVQTDDRTPVEVAGAILRLLPVGILA